MQGCAFCRIVAGEADAFVVYEDDRTVAFLDRNPATVGHTLVVPRAHRESLLACPDAEAVFDTVRHVASGVRRALDADGVSLFYTTGDLVGTVEHAHVHVVPRTAGDGVHLALDRGSLDERRAERLASRLQETL